MLSSNYSFLFVSSCTSQWGGEISPKEKITDWTGGVSYGFSVQSWEPVAPVTRYLCFGSFVRTRGEKKKKIKICYFIFFPLCFFSNWLPLDVRWPAQNFRVEHVEEGVGCVPPLALIFCLAVSCSFNLVVKEKRWDQKIRRPKFSHVYLVL
jgi:hypothetical protein